MRRYLSFLPFLLSFFLSFAITTHYVMGDPPSLVRVATAAEVSPTPSPVAPDLTGTPYSATDATGKATPSSNPLDDPGGVAKLALEAIATGDWWLLAALALSLLVGALFTYGPSLLGTKYPSAAAALTSGWARSVIVVVLAALGGIVHALAAGATFGTPLVIAAVKIAIPSLVGVVGVSIRNASAQAVAQAQAAGMVATKANPPTGLTGVTGDSSRFGK